MKLGNLEFKDYAVQKPVTISPTGEFLTVQKVVDQPVLGFGSLFSLDLEDQRKLTIERYKLEPDFKLGIIGVGILTKDEAMQEIQQETEFGNTLVGAEMGYLNELLSAMSGPEPPAWPKFPTPPWKEIPPWKIWPPWRRRKPCIYIKLPTRALFCENTTDQVTKPFAEYRKKHVHPVFKSRGFTVIVLKGTDDVRANFVPEAKRGLCVYLSGIGHGNYNLYTGHHGDHILVACQYDTAEVKDKSMHFLSCRTGRDLGPDTIAKGANSYAGYIENFILQWDDGSTPAVDEFELFARSDSTYDLMMANGATAQQAFDATYQAFNTAISQVPNQVAATYLTLDRDRLKLHGDPEATIKPFRTLKICFPILQTEKENALLEAGEFED